MKSHFSANNVVKHFEQTKSLTGIIMLANDISMRGTKPFGWNTIEHSILTDRIVRRENTNVNIWKRCVT